MSDWQYLFVTWRAATSGEILSVSINSPWSALFKTELQTPDQGVMLGCLGAAGWELVDVQEMRRDQVVDGSTVAGVLTRWVQIFKRPTTEHARSELAHALEQEERDQRQRVLDERKRITAHEALLESQGAVAMNYFWGPEGLACVAHRTHDCAVCEPPPQGWD